MNYPNFQAEVKSAEMRGEAIGIAKGRREVECVNQRDLDQAWNNGHSRGIVVGSLIGAFLFSAVGGGLALIFL